MTLLERIIQAGSHRGEVVLDPFRGRGTTTRRARALSRQVDAAEKLGRNWIGIDVKQLAISLIKNRLQDTCGGHLTFVSGNSRRESAQTPSPAEDQSGLTSAATESKERGAQAASAPEREATSKRAEARAPDEVHLVRIIGKPNMPNEAAKPEQWSIRQRRLLD